LALGMLGYPSKDADGWPTTKRPAWATLASGIFSQTNVDAPVDLHFPRLQRFWVEASLQEGSSGGPMFLPNGHVAGIICAKSLNDDKTWSTMCTRIDTVHELLQYHRLAGHEPDPQKPSGPRKDWGNDPRLPQLRAAVKKIGEANELRIMGDYLKAGRLCNEVIEGYPDYTYAILERSWVYSDYCNEHWESLAPEVRARFSRWASKDSERCFKAGSFSKPLPYLVHTQNNLLLGRVHSDSHHFEEVVARVDETIEWFSDDSPRYAWALQLRAQARHHLGDLKSAEADFAESIRLDPEEPRWWSARAKFFDATGKSALASEDRRKVEELRKKAEELRKQAEVPLPDPFESPFDRESKSQVRPRAKPIFDGDPR
jgi:tetratricopeptide (TPR) repeat protein